MKIYNTEVQGLRRAIITSGYPMLIEEPEERSPSAMIGELSWWCEEKDINRAKKLGSAPVGSGHDGYLKSIRVWADWQAPNYMWMEIERYHYLDITSSQSKMHRLTKMLDLSDVRLCFNDRVDDRAIELAKEYLQRYKDNPSNDTFETLVANTPLGIELTAGISTNYLQLKTMYLQRKGHKMQFWREIFIDWCKELPYFLELTGVEKED